MLSRPLAAAKCQSLSDLVDLDVGEVVVRLQERAREFVVLCLMLSFGSCLVT